MKAQSAWVCACALAFAVPGCAASTTGVSKVTAVVEPATQYSRCPVLMKTVGIITGSPGSPVTYRFIGNGLPWGPTHRGIIPSSGVFEVIERSRIDDARAGFFFRQVWIIGDGSVLEKFSNRALYTATCGVVPVVSGTTWQTDTPLYQGPCPKVVNFAGTVTGRPGTRIRFSTSGSGAPWGRVRSAILGPSGKLSVSERLSVDAARAGYFYRQLHVMHVAKAIDVLSSRALYSVTCVAGQPDPRAHYMLFDLSAPANFAVTSDPGICADHAKPQSAGAVCGAALANDQLVVLWNWTPNGCLRGACNSAIDGYRIYQVIGKTERLVTTQTNPGLTVMTLAKKAGALTGNCYAVRAFRGSDESPPSNELCVRPEYGEPLIHIVLGPTMTVHPTYSDAIVKFDLSTLSGASVWSARLEYAAEPASSSDRSRGVCLGAVELATADASERSEKPVSAVAYVDSVGARQIDVTSAVRAWVQGTRPNYGFVLRAAEDAGVKSEQTCRSFEGKPILAIDYLNL